MRHRRSTGRAAPGCSSARGCTGMLLRCCVCTGMLLRCCQGEQCVLSFTMLPFPCSRKIVVRSELTSVSPCAVSAYYHTPAERAICSGSFTRPQFGQQTSQLHRLKCPRGRPMKAPSRSNDHPGLILDLREAWSQLSTWFGGGKRHRTKRGLSVHMLLTPNPTFNQEGTPNTQAHSNKKNKDIRPANDQSQFQSEAR